MFVMNVAKVSLMLAICDNIVLPIVVLNLIRVMNVAKVSHI
ncbi:unnamed protein product [Larinioides sclopetarius]|uniref:Uncharacterized protein n=1 Tax=Larinioides sclopetarius TaxID=280406 RepID=A0AAV2BWZ6_9ARAC